MKMKSEKFKTVEQASKEYAESLEDNDYTVETEFAFKAGVTFAQRWIPFDEEDPPMDVWIIVKFEEYYAVIHSKYMFNEIKENFTHWRLINLE